MAGTKFRKPRDFIKERKPSQVVTREEWGAVEPTSREPLQLPVYNVMIKFYTDSHPCDGLEDCKECMRDLQKQYMDQGLPDIPYNFCIGGDDRIYEGRGWFTKPDKVNDDMPQWDGISLDVAYIGQRDHFESDINLTFGGSDFLLMAEENKYLAEDFTFELPGFPDKVMSNGCGDLLESGIKKKCIVGMFNFEILTGIDEVPERLRTFLEIDNY